MIRDFSKFVLSRKFYTSSVNFTTVTAVKENLKGKNRPLDWDKAKPFEEIPGPKAWPVIGNFGRFFIGELAGKDVYQIHQILHKKYGKICSMRRALRNENWVILFKPEDAETAFRNDTIYPYRGDITILDHYRKELRRNWYGDNTGVATENNELWHKFRSTVNPVLMQPRVIKHYLKSMVGIAEELVENVRNLSINNPKNEMPENFRSELHKWALESICLVAMDKKLGCMRPNPDPELTKFITYAADSFDLMHQLNKTYPVWKYYKFDKYKKFIMMEDFLSETVRKYIDEAYENFKNIDKPTQEQSVLEKLLKIDKEMAFIMGIDLLVGGIETTSNVAGATLYHLAKNPKAQDVLRQELLRLLPDKDTEVTTDILEDAKYLKAVIKETTRLVPATTTNVRRAQKDLVISGYQIPKGTQIYASHLLMSMQEFPQGDKFIPERWLKSTSGELSYKNVHPFTTLPFGFGPRSCIGKRIANLEIEVVIAKLIRNFRFEWHYPDLRYRQSLLYGTIDPIKFTVFEV